MIEGSTRVQEQRKLLMLEYRRAMTDKNIKTSQDREERRQVEQDEAVGPKQQTPRVEHCGSLEQNKPTTAEAGAIKNTGN